VLPFRTVGADRRIALDDLLDDRERRDQERMQSIAELTRLSQELGLYE
jgi:hypothetical protein